MSHPLLYLSILILLVSCHEDRSEELVGHWQAYELLEEGELLEPPLEYVYFDFFDNQQYTYHSTLNYREAGTFELSADLLLTMDTLQTEATQKAVRITRLEADTLILEMQEEGKERVLKLYRTNIGPAPGEE